VKPQNIRKWNLEVNIPVTYHSQYTAARLVHVPAAHKLEGHSQLAAT
jgi:hypothetical protein